MAQSSGFFDAEELVDGGFDREYVAEQWANYFKLFIGNGVFSSPTNQLKVIAYSGMHVKLSVGWAFINGYWYHNDAELDLEIPVNVTASTRTDGIFIQWDSADRTIRAVVGEGRTEVDRISPHYELKVAEIFVDIGATAITDANITDTRADSAVCGFVTGVIDVIDSTNLFAQFTSIFEEWFEAMREQAIVDKEDWDAWYAALQEELHNLPPESAEYLQVQIDELKESGLSGSIINISTVNESLQGRTVTITSADGQEVRTGEFDSNLKCTINGFKSVGTATIMATDGLQTATASLTIQYFSNYTVALAFWAATVNIHTTDSALFEKTITITRDGVTVGTTSFDSEGEAVYTATEAGNYTFTCEGNSASVNVTEETTYNVSISGAGLSLASWLTAGSTTAHPINPSSYPTFADVEADEEVVRQLMTVHNAVDYLATSDGTDELIGQIINSDICAKWINLRDYALDTLSANTDIKELMDESDKKIEPLVPAMTSNTTPEGECIASYEYSNLPIWKAFDSGETSEDGWLGYSQAVNQYIGYKFTCPQNVKNFRLYIEKSGSNTFSDAHAVFEASNDGATWETISTHSLGSITTAQFYTFYFNTDNESSYLYYRVRFPEVVHIGGVGGMTIITLQFYGIKKTLMPLVPTMTSNTTPKGEAIAKDVLNSDYDKFKVFDGVLTDGDTWHSVWNAQSTECDKWVGYDFKKPVCVKAFTAFNYTWESSGYYPQNQTSLTLAYSNDGTNWTMVGDAVTLPVGTEIKSIYDNEVSARYWAVFFSDYNRTWVAQSTKACTLTELQFYTYAPHSKYDYGEWVLVGQVPKMTSNTAPYGECLASGAISTHEAYRVFSPMPDDYWQVNYASQVYIGYRFIQPVVIRHFRIQFYTSEYGIDTGKVQGSNDGNTWVDISDTITFEKNAQWQSFDINNDVAYSYYRITSITLVSTTSTIVKNLQFYAWQPKGNVPVMTSNTAPYGEAITSSSNAYLAFDGNMSTNWGGADAPTYSNVGYKFVNPACVKKYTISFREDVDTKYRLQASNDGSTWTDITQEKTYSHTGSKEIIIEDVNNSDYYLYYRIYGVCTTNAKAMVVYRLQFYGRELSVSVPTMTSNTAPYGEVDVTNYISGGSHAGFKAFDGGTPSTSDHCWVGYDPNTSASYGGTSAPVSISYDFGKPVVVKQVSMKLANQSSGNGMEFTIDGYDGSDWIPLKSVAQKTPSGTSFTLYSYDVDNNVAYTKYRLNITKFFGSALYWGNTSQTNYWCAVVGALQFFGRDYSEREFADGSTIKYIYDHGVEFDNVFVSVCNGSSYTEKRVDTLFTHLQGTTSPIWGCLYIQNPIDLTDYSLVRVKAGKQHVGYSSSGCHLTDVSNVAPATNLNWSIFVAQKSYNQEDMPNNLSLDLSSVSGSNYVSTGGVAGSSITAEAEISEWWLE